MMKKTRDEAAVGMFVVVGFIILTVIVFFVSGVYFFRSGYSVNVWYDYVSILDQGAPVRMAGVRVGEVSNVKLAYDAAEQRTRVNVELFIEKGVEIRENYKFTIQGTHILSEPHIEISPQEGNAPLLQDGQTLAGVDAVPIEALVKHANRIAANLDEIVQGLHDALSERETAQALRQMIHNMSDLTHSMNLVMSGSEEDLKAVIRDIQVSSQSLSRILDRIDHGEGTVGKLLTEDELYQEMRAFVSEIRAQPWKLLKRDDKKKKFLIF